jgi:hypothetical protein
MKNVHSSHYIAALLFFGYMAVVSFLFFVLTGASRRSALLPPLHLMLSFRRVLRLRAHLLLCPLDFRSREVGLTRRF